MIMHCLFRERRAVAPSGQHHQETSTLKTHKTVEDLVMELWMLRQQTQAHPSSRVA
jgi:hypothetical protein